MKEPLVSIGLQFFNNGKTLCLAIRSILNQSFQNWELILHDDGSTDSSREIAQRFTDSRIRIYVDDVNRQRPARLNESIDLARGRYFAVMDGDDIAYPDRLSKQVERLERSPEVDLLGAQVLVVDGKGRPIGRRRFPLEHKEICSEPYSGFPIAHVTLMGKTEWFRKYYYDCRTLGIGEDQDLLLRSYQNSKFANLTDILVGVREPSLRLKKILVARYFLCIGLIRQAVRQRDFAFGVLGITGQMTRTSLDLLAIGTGLNYHLLRHRARPITDQERQEWARVWESVNRDEQAQR